MILEKVFAIPITWARLVDIQEKDRRRLLEMPIMPESFIFHEGFEALEHLVALRSTRLDG